MVEFYSTTLATHCPHGLDMRLYPRCFLCTPLEPTPGYTGSSQQAVVEFDEYLCPNCLTPWKCNGPHIPEDWVKLRLGKF